MPRRLLRSSVPLYKEVKEKIIQALTAGAWVAGDRIPSESELAKRYGVAVSTIRAAIGELVDANVLVRRQGKGTFVSEHTSPRNLYRFFHIVRDDGVREIPARELISFRQEPADESLVELLQLKRYRRFDVFSIRLVFKVGGQVIGHSVAVVPVALFPKLTAESIRESELTLYALYQTRHNVNVLCVSADLRATAVPEEVAPYLNLPPGAPVLEIERVAYTYQDVPVEKRTVLLNTASCRYRLEQGSSV